MSAAIVKVAFAGDELSAFERDGKRFVVLRPIAESLGLGYGSLTQTLKSKAWATVTTIVTVGADGKRREMLAVDTRTLLMLLATIDESRVSASARPKLVVYQAEVAEAIESFFVKGYALHPGATPQQKADGHEAWRRWLADGVEDHEALWVGRVVEELARLWRQPAKVDQAGGFPVGLIAAVRRCYHSVVGGPFYNALREKTGFGEEREKRYRGLTRDGYELLSREIVCIERIARTCRTKEEFIDKMNHVYGGEPMQTGFW